MHPGATSAADLLRIIPPGVELVHFMAPPEAEALTRLPCAGLLTVHGNGKPGERFIRNSVFLTADHARRHGAEVFVFNGVDPDEFCFEPESKKNRSAAYLFLSKTSWKVKNLSGALRRCRRAGVPLWIAGGNRPWSLRLQALSVPGVTWKGPVSGQRKAELLARARALVFPILWPEPFGLVVIESLVSGTPVIASRLGSTPELIGSEVGLLLDPADEEGWVAALASDGTRRFDPERCRAWALERFTHRTMAESYERLYRRVASGESLHAVSPTGPVARRFDVENTHF
jgi:glycosyltransferase involved in cell wall biosynthesis